MAARVVMRTSWESLLTPGIEALFRTRLGPDILADARRAVPVDTGALYRDLDHETHGAVLRVGPKGDTDYGGYVEMGSTHTRANGTTYQIAAQPFLRPSIFTRRSR